MAHKSLRTAASDVSLFPELFPDSEIAANIHLQKDKISYISVYGLYPHFFEELNTELHQQEFIVLGFDESHNKISKNCQMDINVRYRNESNNKVVTRYYSSAFLGKTKATDLLQSFTATIARIDSHATKNNSTINQKKPKILQVSLEGPNVNFKFLELFQKYLGEEEEDVILLKLGSCGLHTVNNSFKTAFIFIKWELCGFLRALYNLMKDSPARRALYTYYSKSLVFPLKFCAIRWVENVRVAERAITIIPAMKLFVEGLKANKEEPNSYSYKVVVKHLNDKLLVPKLTFFKFVASKVEPFLREYQSDKPLAPFLFSSLMTMLLSLCELFVKPEVLKASSNLAKLDVFKEENLKPVGKVEIGFETSKALGKVPFKITDAEFLDFRKSVRLCYQKMVSKLQDKSPLKYQTVKAITCFDPAIAATSSGKDRAKNLLKTLVDHNIITGSEGDLAHTDYSKLCEKSRQDLKSYKRYSKNKEDDFDLDTFWSQLAHKHLNDKSLKNFMKIVKITLILSHGNANLERGFSVNAECLNPNLEEKSLIARRSIYDHVLAIGGIEKFKVTNPLQLSVSKARSRYKTALENMKQENSEKLRALKRKKQNDIVVKELKQKKIEIMNDALKRAKMIDDELSKLTG